MNNCKKNLCVVLLNNFQPCRFAPRVKSETEQVYHKIYLVYARQKITHANANLGMKKELDAN